MAKRKKRTAQETRDDKVFKALAGVDRRHILDLLKNGARTTGELCDEMPWLNRCTVMQHLGVLEEARLVIPKKDGRVRWNYLDVSPIQRIHERWIGSFAAPSASLLSQLQQDLESV